MEDYLMHYGVKGMHWGVRRYQNYDGTRIGRKRKLWGFNKISYNKRMITVNSKNRTKQDKITIKEAQEWDDKEHKKIKNLVNNLTVMKTKMSRVLAETDDKSNLPLKSRQTSPEQDMEKINPGRKGTTVSGKNNCCLCTMAFDMRRRGFDVIARQKAPIDILYDVSSKDVLNVYKNAKEVKTGSIVNLNTKLKKEPEGSRGAVFVKWKGGKSGHVVAYQIENRRPVLYDAQNNEKYTNMNDLFKNAEKSSYIRLDNLKPNYKRIKWAIE